MNDIVRSSAGMPVTQDGWVWDGTKWVCDPDCDLDPCPPRHFFPRNFFPPVVAPPMRTPLPPNTWMPKP